MGHSDDGADIVQWSLLVFLDMGGCKEEIKEWICFLTNCRWREKRV